MSAPSSKKRPAADDNGHPDERARVARPATKRPRSRSVSSTEHLTQLNLDISTNQNRPPSGYDLDRLNYHYRLQDFGVKLQKAANAVFPEGQNSRYTKVDVILLSWEDEDPKLPVSLEIRELADTFTNVYGYYVEEWLIPAEDSHNKLQVKILQFLWIHDPSRLIIVYYAGHGKLTNHGQPAWTSRRNSQKERCPTIKWSGIQNSLEESQSDVLILLDCCSSGVCTTDEGNGVTELIAACAYNATANGVGPFSFTHALNAKLRQLSQLPSFSIGQLYNAIFTEVQGWRLEDSHHKKAPVHLVLSQNQGFPRSICLSKQSKPNPTVNIPIPLGYPAPVDQSQPTGSSVFGSPSPEEPRTPSSALFSQNTSVSSSMTSLADLPEYPRLFFSIRVSNDVKPNDFSVDLFLDWLRTVPIPANLIRVEAGFASDSTLVLFSICPAILAYLPEHPAITLLGTIKSKNLMATLPQTHSPETKDEPEAKSKMKPPFSPPSASSSKKEDPNPPKGGCRYIMFREDNRPMTCACQGLSQDISAHHAVCDCGHKPCYHLATRSQTVYRQELEALTKKVYSMEQDVRRMRLRSGGMPSRTEDRDRVAMGYRGRQNTNERPPGMYNPGSYHVQGQPGPGLWNFRGP